MLAEWLKEGAHLRLLEYGDPVDELTVLSLQSGVMEAESRRLYPGKKTEFLYVPEAGGWKVATYGLDDERCFSELAPTYTLEPLEESS